MLLGMEVLPWYLTGFFSVLLFSAFVKIVTTLSIVRYGIGLHGTGFGIVVIALSLALALVVMPEEIQQQSGVRSIIGGRAAPSQSPELEQRYLNFVSTHTDLGVKEKLKGVVGKIRKSEKAEQRDDLALSLAAFLVSQVREAFIIGLLILIPFVVVDLLVVNLLMALGIQQMSQMVVSLPLKLLLFVAVDGWTLLAERLLAGYVN